MVTNFSWALHFSHSDESWWKNVFVAWVSFVPFPPVYVWREHNLNHDQMAGEIQRVWGQRCNERTSFSGPVAVFSSFLSSLCIEISSCCRIISWNWAIPRSVSPLPRPGQGREEDGDKVLQLTQTFHILTCTQGDMASVFACTAAELLYTDIRPDLERHEIKVT